MKNEKRKLNCASVFIYKKILGIDGLFLAGEAIRDMVLTVIVITFLINNVLLKLPPHSNLYILIISFAIMLTPLSVAVKWLDKIYQGKNKLPQEEE